MLAEIKKKLPSDVHNVFYESKKNPYSHFPRQETDGRFQRCIKEGSSMLVYGGSYTGKTFLVHHNFPDEDAYIKIDCFENMTLKQVYAQILKNVGYQVVTEVTTSTSSTTQVTASVDASLLDLANFGLHGTIERSDGIILNKVSLELCLDNPNDIIMALRGMNFDKYIVLSMFNKLPDDVQNALVKHLEAFLSSGIKLVIVYTGTSPAIFQDYISNWPQQFIPFDQDTWSSYDLRGYIKYCADWLNIEFAEHFMDTLLDCACGRFQIVRKVCYRACLNEGIYKTQPRKITIGGNQDAKLLIRSVLLEKPSFYAAYTDVFRKVIQTDPAVFHKFLAQFSSGLKINSPNECYKWILYCVLTASPTELTTGIQLMTITDKIKARHGNAKLKSQSIKDALSRIGTLQKKKCDSRIFLKYQEDAMGTSLLKIVDPDFLLWLFIRNKKELLSMLDLPTD